jgi:hypothetical protein
MVAWCSSRAKVDILDTRWAVVSPDPTPAPDPVPLDANVNREGVPSSGRTMGDGVGMGEPRDALPGVPLAPGG